MTIGTEYDDDPRDDLGDGDMTDTQMREFLFDNPTGWTLDRRIAYAIGEGYEDLATELEATR
jgi:hypothetical protein